MPIHPRPFLLRCAAGLTPAQLSSEIGVKSAEIRRWDAGLPPSAGQLEQLEHLAARATPLRRPAYKEAFTFVDLFAGIGGLRQAFAAAGGKCLLTAEWNKFAIETYAANFDCDHPVHGDVTKLDAQDNGDVPDHDILVAGFPCQPFSLAGVSKKNSLGRPHGFDDPTQGTLFFDVKRIIAGRRPKAFVLENVKNLKSHDGGRTMQVILDTLERELGYAVSHKVLDSSKWVPQKRERIVIVGMREGPAFDFGTLEIPPQGPLLGSILHSPLRESSWDDRYARHGDTERYRLSPHLWSYLRDYAAKHTARGNGFGFGLVGEGSVTRTLSARYYKDGSEILVDMRDEGSPRRLTPRECARLMGFDKPGLPPFRIIVSDTQAWKQFGNSVVVPMFEAVSKALARRLSEDSVEQKSTTHSPS